MSYFSGDCAFWAMCPSLRACVSGRDDYSSSSFPLRRITLNRKEPITAARKAKRIRVLVGEGVEVKQ